MGRTVKDIVWTKYLSERTLLKAWHILENNYFKGAIKKVRDNGGVVSYSMGHNSLYMGLYFSEEDFLPSDKPLLKIRQNLGLKSYVTISNVLPPYEVLKNIHAMHIAGKNIFENLSEIQNNSGLVYELCHQAGKQMANVDIDKTKVNSDSQSLVLVQPNCYRYVKKIKKDLSLGKPIGTVFGEGKKAKSQKFKNALKKYNDVYLKIVAELENHGIFGAEKQKACLAELDNGLYCTMLGNVGFDINELLQKQNPNDYVSRKELELHTQKLLLATKKLEKTSVESFNDIKKDMWALGDDLRKKYIFENKTYPECGKGFYNCLASVLVKNMKYVNIFDEAQTKNYPKELKEIMQKIAKLEQQYQESKSEEQKKKIFDKMDKIAEILEQ